MFHPLLLALVALTLTAFALSACTGAFFLPARAGGLERLQQDVLDAVDLALVAGR